MSATTPTATLVPDLIYLLAVLACPLGMGAMMLTMMRHDSAHDADRDHEVADLRADEQRLSSGQQPPECGHLIWPHFGL